MPPALANDLGIDSAVTWNQVKAGCDVQIRVLSGPSCDRLRDLGFCEEMRIRKIRRPEPHLFHLWHPYGNQP